MRSVLLILDESLCADAIPSSLKSLAETPVIASSIEEAQRLLDASFFSLVLAPAALLGELSAPETSMRLGLARSEAEAIACLEAGAAGSLSLPISAPLLEAYLRRAELRRDELLLARAHRIAFEEATDAMEIADAQTRILRVNRAFERSTGYSSEEALGQTPGALMRSRAHDPSFYDDIEARLGRGESWSGALVGRRKDGTLVHQAARILGVMDDAAELALQVAIKEHLTFAAPRGLPPRSPADESDTPASLRMLARSEERLRRMIESAADALLVADLQSGYVLEANPAAQALFGYALDDLLAMRLDQLSPGQFADLVDASTQTLRMEGLSEEERFPMQRGDGSEFWGMFRASVFEFRGQALVVAAIRDVSQQVAREDRLTRAYADLETAHRALERSAQLAAIGSLAAGVAHEINNPLHFVMLSLESLEEGLEAPSREQRELLADIGQGLHRIRSISKTVLPFARFDAGEASAVDLNEAVRLAAKMAGNELRHRARVHLELGELPPLIGHPNMIGQLLTNLLSNAAQAIGEGSAALNEVRIETGCEGDTIYARISDTGPGIEPSMREDIFKRFYTSKPPGQGTGLGLALCADVAQAHGGTIHVAESRLGGATFEIRIPIRTGLEPTRQKVASGTIRKRSARVLLVDDDPLVLRGHARRLRRGFEAVCAESGAAALSILESDQAFDVILCDVMMPDMDGPEFYRQVELLYPDLCERFVFCTGGAFTSRAQVFLEQVGRPVIQKPIETPHLRAALYEAMGVGALSPPEVCEEG